MITIDFLENLHEIYEKVFVFKGVEEERKKQLKKELELKMTAFLQSFLGDNRERLLCETQYLIEQYHTDLLSEPVSRELNHALVVLLRVEQMILTYTYKSIVYLARDLVLRYKQVKENYEDAALRAVFFEEELLQYILEVVEQAIKIPNSNQYFKKVIVENYKELISRIRKIYPSENPHSLLHEVYQVLTSKKKDKLPPSTVRKDIIGYIIQACRFLMLSHNKKKKEKERSYKVFDKLPLIPLVLPLPTTG